MLVKEPRSSFVREEGRKMKVKSVSDAAGKQGIWSGTPWSGRIQNWGLFWMEMQSANPNSIPKLRPILDWNVDFTPKISEFRIPCRKGRKGLLRFKRVLFHAATSSPSSHVSLSVTVLPACMLMPNELRMPPCSERREGRTLLSLAYLPFRLWGERKGEDNQKTTKVVRDT